MPETAPQEPGKLWIPPENYYEQIGESNTNSFVNFVGRLGVAAYTFVAFGRIQIVTTPGFDEAQPTFPDGNIIVASIHRDERDTVMLPLALERVGIHHSRPVAKSELYMIHPLVSRFFHAAGAFAVDRKNPDFSGLGMAQDRILERGGNITNYLEGTRIRRNTGTVAEVKRSVVFAAAEHDSLIVPAAFAGLSSEIEGEGDNKVKISRDKRSRFGLGSRLVFAFTDPMRFGPLPVAEFDSDGRQTIESKNQVREESKRRAARIRSGMQLALDMAIEYRGSTQEFKYQSTK
jgi:1-acyl-sn-glycerol-3-phosphate acyltransferase